MMMFIWFCVMTSAFFPGGERAASLHSSAVQGHVRASVEQPIMTLGWVSRDDEQRVVATAADSAAEPYVRDRIRAAQAALEALPARARIARKPRRAIAA